MPDQNPYAKYGGTLAPTGSPQPEAGAPAANNPYAKYGGTLYTPTAPRVQSNESAAQPGAYQQAPTAPIRNAQTEAANPFTDTTTSVIPDLLGTKQTGALLKRPEESDSQFLTRVREAAKTVKPSAIEVEHRSNIARTVPTLGAAAVAGPAQILAAEGAAELPGAGKKAVEVAKTVGEWAKANRLKALALEGIARELGVDPFQLTAKAMRYGKHLFGE